MSDRNALFARRQRRTRYALRQAGGGRPRLSVFRSGKHIYAQVIDDTRAVSLVACSDLSKELQGGDKQTKSERAKAVGVALAKLCLAKGITKVVFDRNGYIYHGRVSALADGAREGGLDF